MSLALKIVFGIFALILLTGFGFYLWLVAAYTPPKSPDNPAREDITIRAVTEGEQPVYFAIGWRDLGSGPVYGVTISAPTDDISGQDVLIVRGTPVPIDVRTPKKGQVDIVFDSKLESGSDIFTINIDEGYSAASGMTVIENGKLRTP